MRRNLISSFQPVILRSGVTARHVSKKISAHEPVNRVIVLDRIDAEIAGVGSVGELPERDQASDEK